MAKRSTNVVPLATVKPVQFGDALSERYLSYALSTIMARSLPDVRDGLKPVHRRLLYAMRQLRLDPNSAFKKSARVVGDEIAVDFRPNYDGSTEEPIVLPGGFPNLLANGAAGIAVGMACSIPPHNAGELCDALLHLIKTPNARIDTLVDLVKGPDFPTGGILVEPREAIVEAYKTGRGAFRLRAKWEKEELPRGQYRIIVTEIPYQVQKGKL